MDSSENSSRRLAHNWPYPRRGPFVDHLRQSAAAWFAKRNYEVVRGQPYCLAHSWEWPQNMILMEVASYIEALQAARHGDREPFLLHRSLHNGLSSQALLFNLVGPLIVGNDLEPLQKALGTAIPLPNDASTAILEYWDRSVFNEDAGQPTSVDLVLGQPDRPGALFIEAKLVETGFGGCNIYREGDCDGANPVSDFSRCYLHYIGRKYWPLLDKHGFLQTSFSSERTCPLAAHYQFFREASLAVEKQGYLVLLTDQRSPVFHCTGPYGERGLMPFLANFVPDSVKTYVRQVSIQEIANAIEYSPTHSWIRDFQFKYGM